MPFSETPTYPLNVPNLNDDTGENEPRGLSSDGRILVKCGEGNIPPRLTGENLKKTLGGKKKEKDCLRKDREI